MDWSTVATAAVGIAGIGATLWLGMYKITSDNARAYLAEKRRVYASCLASINAAIPTFTTNRRARDWPNEDARMEAWVDANKARTAMLNAVMELELFAPKDVTQHAQQVRGRLIGY